MKAQREQAKEPTKRRHKLGDDQLKCTHGLHYRQCEDCHPPVGSSEIALYGRDEVTTVGEMARYLPWAVTNSHAHKAHIATSWDARGRIRTECGIYALSGPVLSALASTPVCKRCLKATEKYA